MKRTLRLLPLALLCAVVLVLATTGSGPAADPPPRSAEDVELVGKNVELVTTAFTLKEYGSGKDVKGGIQGYSLESLLAAARILREVPKPAKFDAKVEVSKEGENNPGAEVPKEEPVDLVAESTAILDRAKEILKLNVTDPEKFKAYDTLIKDIEKNPGGKAVKGGPKVISRTLQPGDQHDYYWEWEWHALGAVGFQASAPITIQVINTNTKNVYGAGHNHAGLCSFTPGGPGKLDGKFAKLFIRLHNGGKAPVKYQLFVN
jgi:hypothetical protein